MSKPCSSEGCNRSVSDMSKTGICAICKQRAQRAEARVKHNVKCRCGCGALVNPGRSFVGGHSSKAQEYREAMSAARFKNASRIGNHGYVVVSRDGRQVLEHIHIAEQAIGKPLPNGAEVHHINGTRTDNRNSNLVICQDASYHRLLHKRQRALDASGNANNIPCGYCGKYDSPENMYIRKDKYGYGYHRECERNYYALNRDKLVHRQRIKRQKQKLKALESQG